MYGTNYLSLAALVIGAFAANAQSEGDSTLSAVIADESFFQVFIDDLYYDGDKYSSYMAENSMSFPPTLVQVYNQLPNLNDQEQITYLEKNFPFSQFYTFVTAFPWYTELLVSASATQFYLPDDSPTDTVTSTASASSTMSAFPGPGVSGDSQGTSSFTTFVSSTGISAISSPSPSVSSESSNSHTENSLTSSSEASQTTSSTVNTSGSSTSSTSEGMAAENRSSSILQLFIPVILGFFF